MGTISLHTLARPDDRQIAWSEFGDLHGAPVFYCHGFPSCRLEAGLAHDAARRVGARLIALDRPGLGRSTFRPGLSLHNWCEDLIAVADHLGIARFAMLAVSGGAPFALAAAAQRPERITRLGIVSGLGSLPASVAGAAIHPILRRTFALARHGRVWQTSLCVATVAMARLCPARVVTRFAAHLSAPDRALLRDPCVAQTLIASTREALRQGARAVCQSLRLYARDWGIALDCIAVPVVVWHGEADVVVPPAMARQLVAALPPCEVHFVPGEGHYSLPLRHTDAVLQRLLDGNQ